MKIYHVIDSGGLYGAEAMLLDLMQEQQVMGYLPVLCSIGIPECTDKEIETRARERGLEVVLFRMRAGLNIAGAIRILKAARSNEAEILHCHGYKADILLGLMPPKIRKIPLVSTLHGWTNTRSFSRMTIYEWLHIKALRHSNAVILVNSAMRDDKRLINANIESNRLFVVPNGIMIDASYAELTDVNITRRIAQFKGNSFLIGTAGRLSREKGYDYLIRSVAIVRSEGYDAKLVIFGAGKLLEELKILSKQLGLEEVVLFVGYQSNARSYFHQINVFVLSSLSEGLPITILEAMAEKTPVVATRVGGIPELIADTESAILVEPENPEALAKGLVHIISNPTESNLMVEIAEALIRNHYSSEAMAQSYINIYNLNRHNSN